MNRILTLLLAFGLMSGPTFGQAANDAAPTSAEYTFRFVADKDMFYVPWSGNGEELERLLTCIAQHKGAILEGVIPVEVYGYCNSQATAAENLAMAKIRSNRVKSEMILRGGLTESCFTTKNHTSGGNQVIVRIVLPAEKPAGQPTPAAPVPETPATPAETTPADSADAVPPVLEAPAEETPVDAGEKSCLSNLSLRANLLRWATLTPDVGLEWRIGNRWSIGVNGSWTSWSWNDKERRYALWEVAPEVRCYLGEKTRPGSSTTSSPGRDVRATCSAEASRADTFCPSAGRCRWISRSDSDTSMSIMRNTSSLTASVSARARERRTGGVRSMPGSRWSGTWEIENGEWKIKHE